jgi:hypothetical protein
MRKLQRHLPLVRLLLRLERGGGFDVLLAQNMLEVSCCSSRGLLSQMVVLILVYARLEQRDEKDVELPSNEGGVGGCGKV